MDKDHLEVILENIDGKFDLVLEGYSTLNQKIDNLAQRTDERFDLVDLKFEAVHQRMDHLENKIDAVAADLKATDKRLGDKIDAVAVDLKAHRSDTEAHGGIYQVKEN